jgi:hypothetical protein
MADELNIPTHRYYQPRNNIKLAKGDFSKQWIYDSGIQKIDAWINSQPWGNPVSQLFALNEPGVWYDPSDLTTLFTDPAGTTPVTTPGQTVALMLDKSKGGQQALPTTGWSKNSGDGVVTIVDNVITITGATTTTRVDVNSPGWDVGNYARITVNASIGSAVDPFMYIGGTLIAVTSGVGTYSTVISSNTLLRLQVTSGSATFTVTARSRTPGNHATQATAASRPIYGVVPQGGRRNLLTFSEQLDNAAWPKSNVTVIANASTAPDGALTAERFIADATTANHRVISTAVTLASGVNCVHSVYLKAGTHNFVQIHDGASASYFANFNVSTGVVGTTTGCTAVMTNVGDGWYRCSIAMTLNGANPVLCVSMVSSNTAARNESWAAAGTETVFVWGAQLEQSATATPYQRVTTQYDVTEAGVQSLSYLDFDGSGDFMETGTITPGVDKVQVFAGVRKLASSVGVIAELSASTDSNVGTFVLYNQSTAGWGINSRGNVSPPSVAQVATGYAPPISNVITGTGDISGDSVVLRANGTQVAQSTADQGINNYLAYPLYIGRRNATANLYLTGQLYGLITRFGPNLASTNINATEYWLNEKTGAY